MSIIARALTSNLPRLAALILVILALICPRISAAEGGPDAAVSSFYTWYLTVMDAGHDPEISDPATLSVYVSKPLLNELRQAVQQPGGVDEDYFLKAQDYLDDWVGHVSVGQPRSQDGAAVVDIVLGVAPESRKILWVTTIQEGGAWKIRAVREAHPGSGQQ
jgi:hypothetical protein